jgi:hypothetical protein
MNKGFFKSQMADMLRRGCMESGQGKEKCFMNMELERDTNADRGK